MPFVLPAPSSGGRATSPFLKAKPLPDYCRAAQNGWTPTPTAANAEKASVPSGEIPAHNGRRARAGSKAVLGTEGIGAPAA